MTTHLFDARNDWRCVGCGIEASVERFEESCPVGEAMVEAVFVEARASLVIR